MEDMIDFEAYPVPVAAYRNHIFVNPSWVQSGNGGPLSEWDWSDSTFADEPAGQDDQVDGVTTPPANDDTSDPQHISPQNSNDPEDLSEPTASSYQFQCPECSMHFEKKKQLTYAAAPEYPSLPRKFLIPDHLRIHHRRHTRPFRCQVAECSKMFALKKDLKRHVEETHGPMRWHCTFPGCMNKLAVDGTARKANLDRHLRTQHAVAAPGRARNR
ncbi:hypothetical protein PG994_011914 [Apiospora phragmitis]|uniref:C2H2-type domain-containing protein n=1 Tax=Apiospora phragmitis TaxID=2905665 RepID=A0ABR1TU50_9PEZI